jgi:hypothetical protein
MTTIWTKPTVGAVAFSVAGAFTLSLDSIAQSIDPLTGRNEHDTFQPRCPLHHERRRTRQGAGHGNRKRVRVACPEPLKKTQTK